MNRFDLEQEILKTWNILDDLDTVIEGVLDEDWSPDQVSNALIGIKEIYASRFSKTFSTFEKLIAQGDIK